MYSCHLVVRYKFGDYHFKENSLENIVMPVYDIGSCVVGIIFPWFVPSPIIPYPGEIRGIHKLFYWGNSLTVLCLSQFSRLCCLKLRENLLKMIWGKKYLNECSDKMRKAEEHSCQNTRIKMKIRFKKKMIQLRRKLDTLSQTVMRKIRFIKILSYFNLPCSLTYSLCPVGWGCRINRLFLHRGVRYPQWMSWYDIKLSDSEVWGMWSTPWLPLLSGSLWSGVVVPDRVLSMGQIQLCTYAKLNCLK